MLGSESILCKACYIDVIYDRYFNLERPFQSAFVVNNSCFCSHIIAIWLQFGLKVHTSLLDRFGKFKVFLLPGNKVISAYEPGGELRIVKKCVRPGKEY